MKFKGFTLSEILITLGIIGVVAAMTIPNILYKYQTSEHSARIKKAYGLVSTAIEEAWRTSMVERADQLDSTRVNNAINATLKVRARNSGWYTIYGNGGYSYQTIGYPGYNRIYTLPDGTVFSYLAQTYINGYSGIYIRIDSNGQKGPNQMGADVFDFFVYGDQPTLRPHPGYRNSYTSTNISYCKNNCYNYNYCLYCTAALMGNGWEITW